MKNTVKSSTKATKTSTKAKTLKAVKTTTPKTSTKQTKPKATTSKKPNLKVVENIGTTVAQELSFKSQAQKLPEKLRIKITEAFLNLGVKDLDELKIYPKTKEELPKLPGNTNYAIIDVDSETPRYEITNKDFTKVYKNRSCGTWKRIISNQNVFVYTF